MIHIDYPFQINGRGRSASTGDDEHIRDLIEQVLFTAPGERVNRPDFGSGLLQLVFAPNSDELAAAVQHSVQAALCRTPSSALSRAVISAGTAAGPIPSRALAAVAQTPASA